MALPKEPRQKMINLMYLVLTALLALNVSAEILNAFKTVNSSLVTANGTIDAKNKDLFASFEEKKKDPTTSERANIWYPKADEARKLSEDLVNYIEGIKTDIMKAAGYNPAKGDTTYSEDNLEATTRVMSDPGTKGNELKKKLDDFKTKILGIDPSINKEFANILPINTALPKSVNAASKKDWGTAYFNMVPAIAAVTILSKFQNDVKNSEAMVVDYCHRQVGAVEVVFNTYQPLVGQSSNYLMPGQELTITAGIGAYNSAARPNITIDGSTVNLNSNGVAEFKTNVGGPGSYTKMVHITYINQSTGKTETKEFPVAFTVGSPTGTSVSAEDVKVLYIGLQNHLSITSNVGDEKISAQIDNGRLTKTAAGRYIAEPSKPGTATVHLNVDGKPQDVQFRVKTVPDPVAKVGNSKGGTMKANEFKAQFGVRADLENFVFEGVKFNVVGYTIVLNGAGFPQLKAQQVTGAAFDPVRNLIEQARPGTSVIIDEIRAQGPDGIRRLPPIAFNLTP